MKSIRWRNAIPFAVLILLLMIAMGAYTSSILRKAHLADLEQQLSTEAKMVAESLKPELKSNGASLILDEQARFWAEQLNSRVTLIATDGTVIGESDDDRTRMDNHANRPEIIQAERSGLGMATRFSHTEGVDMLYVATRVEEAGDNLGYVRLAMPVTSIDTTIRQLQKTIFWFALLAAAIAIMLALWIASRITQPIRELTKAADRIANGDLGQNILPSTADEVGKLTKSFNVMGEQLRAKINALEAEQTKLNSVLNMMSDGVVMLDSEGKIQLINPAAESMFNISHEESMNRSLIEAFRQHQLVDLWKLHTATNEPQAGLIEIPNRRLYLQCQVTSLGKVMPGSTLILIQNLTRLRRLETIRQDFMSNISHELRTPLASLKALTETLQDTALEDPPAARRFLQRMETEVDAISLIVSELLELSRIESGKVPLRMESVSPIHLIDKAVERLQLQAEKAELTISTGCEADCPPILADLNRMEQVLVNLLHNAIKFTPSGGQIMIGCRYENEMMLFYVQDTGIGIPAEDMSRIFERFFKSDRARSGSGTGLGLAIARHLIEAHGGKIWAESTEGHGSTFFFTLPLAG